jgi:hypothetical protein
MRTAITAAFIAIGAFAGCGEDSGGREVPAPPTARLTFLDVLDPPADPPEEGARNLLEVRDAEGDRLLRDSWRGGLEGGAEIEAIDAEAGEYEVGARAVDGFAVSDERLVESCEGSVTVDPAQGDVHLVLVSRDWAGECEIDSQASLCPDPATRGDDDVLLERAELVFEGLHLTPAEELAAAGGCHVAPTSIDGEPQPLTREYDPTRIKVSVRGGIVREVSSFG